MKSAYLGQVAEVLESRARLVAEHLNAVNGLSDSAVIDSLCKRLGRVSATRVTIIGADGKVLGDTNDDPTAMENHAHRPEFETAMSGGIGMSTRYSNTVQRQMMYVAIPLVQDGRLIGGIRTAAPVSDIDEHVSVFRTHVTLADSP
jgi:two-component system phosphate regulon sensor histidine kinase PhoR